MSDILKSADAQETIEHAIGALLARRGADDVEITRHSRLSEDLGLDSLELAELSAVLEDELGGDPFSEGILPDTVGELADFYDDH
jgi:acyl carrier protein